MKHPEHIKTNSTEPDSRFIKILNPKFPEPSKPQHFEALSEVKINNYERFVLLFMVN